MIKWPIRRNSLSSLAPPLAGLVLVVMFVMLGLWQLDRAEEKRAVQESFDNAAEYLPLDATATYELYQPLSVSGRYWNERQILIDNIVLDGRLGFYVITPLEYAPDKPLLLVNRGWIAKQAAAVAPPAAGHAQQRVRGRYGQLPRVGIRPGEPFEGAAGWPRVAVWPELGDIAAELGRDVLPFVLLADPDPAAGFLRRWEPQQPGPSRHLGYAVQWFALALTVVVIGIVVGRRQGRAP